MILHSYLRVNAIEAPARMMMTAMSLRNLDVPHQRAAGAGVVAGAVAVQQHLEVFLQHRLTVLVVRLCLAQREPLAVAEVAR